MQFMNLEAALAPSSVGDQDPIFTKKNFDNGNIAIDSGLFARIESVLEEQSRCLIVGAHHSGKTCLAKYLAFRRSIDGWRVMYITPGEAAIPTAEQIADTIEKWATLVRGKTLLIFEDCHEYSDAVDQLDFGSLDSMLMRNKCQVTFTARRLTDPGWPTKDEERGDWILECKPSLAHMANIVRMRERELCGERPDVPPATDDEIREFLGRIRAKRSGNLRILRLYLMSWTADRPLGSLTEADLLAHVDLLAHRLFGYRIRQLPLSLLALGTYEIDVLVTFLSERDQDIVEKLIKSGVVRSSKAYVGFRDPTECRMYLTAAAEQGLIGDDSREAAVTAEHFAREVLHQYLPTAQNFDEALWSLTRSGNSAEFAGLINDGHIQSRLSELDLATIGVRRALRVWTTLRSVDPNVALAYARVLADAKSHVDVALTEVNALIHLAQDILRTERDVGARFTSRIAKSDIPGPLSFKQTDAIVKLLAPQNSAAARAYIRDRDPAELLADWSDVNLAGLVSFVNVCHGLAPKWAALAVKSLPPLEESLGSEVPSPQQLMVLFRGAASRLPKVQSWIRQTLLAKIKAASASTILKDLLLPANVEKRARPRQAKIAFVDGILADLGEEDWSAIGRRSTFNSIRRMLSSYELFDGVRRADQSKNARPGLVKARMVRQLVSEPSLAGELSRESFSSLSFLVRSVLAVDSESALLLAGGMAKTSVDDVSNADSEPQAAARGAGHLLRNAARLDLVCKTDVANQLAKQVSPALLGQLIQGGDPIDAARLAFWLHFLGAGEVVLSVSAAQWAKIVRNSGVSSVVSIVWILSQIREDLGRTMMADAEIGDLVRAAACDAERVPPSKAEMSAMEASYRRSVVDSGGANIWVPAMGLVDLFGNVEPCDSIALRLKKEHRRVRDWLQAERSAPLIALGLIGLTSPPLRAMFESHIRPLIDVGRLEAALADADLPAAPKTWCSTAILRAWLHHAR